MRNGGALSANDWRADEGLNPLDAPEGDMYVMQGQYVPLADIGKKPEPAPAAPPVAPPAAAESEPESEPVEPVMTNGQAKD